MLYNYLLEVLGMTRDEVLLFMQITFISNINRVADITERNRLTKNKAVNAASHIFVRLRRSSVVLGDTELDVAMIYLCHYC